MNKRLKQVSLFFDAAHSMSSEVVDFHAWFSLSFVMQWMIALQSPFAASRDQIHHRLRFCCDPFFTWIFLRSFRHHFRTIGRTDMDNVNKHKRWSIHHVWNFPWSVCLRVGFWCQFISMSASLSSNTYNKASWREELTFEEIKSTLSRSSIIPWDFFRFWSVWGTARTSRWFVHKSHRAWLRVSVKNCNDQIPQVKRGYTIQPQTCIQGNDFWFCAKLKFVS